MARKEEESAISLFSFQDIITSLTGIMFLVVLLLVLLLLSSHKIVEPEAASPDTTALQEQLSALKQKLQQLEQSEEEAARQLATLRALSPEEIKKRIQEMQIQIQKQQEHLQSTEIELKTTQERLQLLQNEISVNNEQNESLQSELEALKKKIQEIKTAISRQHQENEANRNLMQFTIERSSGKSPLLLELDKNGIIMLAVDSQEKIDFSVHGNPQESINKFLSHLSKYPAGRYYICILVKPSGFPYTNNLVMELKNKKFERGVEIMPDETSTVFGGSKK